MLINGTDSYRCTGTYRSMEDALAGIGSDVPDVALVDIGLPGMSGIEGIALLKARHPDLLLLMLTVYDDDERIFDALCAGACGYLLKRTPPARLLEYLKRPCPAARRFRRRSRGAWSRSSGRSARRIASTTS